MSEFVDRVDLAGRSLGGGVMAASDEWFAEKENLLKAEPAVHDPDAFGPKGKTYDGWETRRRREPGHDWAVIRLGAPGIVRSVVVDTAFFRGNYPEEVSVEACGLDGAPDTTALLADGVDWEMVVPGSPVEGDTRNVFEVDLERRFTHLRLNMYPDGGIARFRAYGDVVPDPRYLAGAPFDLLAQEHGGLAVDCSDRFFSSPNNLNAPGLPRHMGEGWENRRRRGPGNDWVLFRLAAAGLARVAEIDTTFFLGNAPGEAALRGCDATTSSLDAQDAWFDIVPRQKVVPDTRHRYLVDEVARATHVRLDVYPDGGVARVRLFGDLDAQARSALAVRWFDLMPAAQALAVLAGCGASRDWARALEKARPLRDRAGVDAALAAASRQHRDVGEARVRTMLAV
ncbi:MAG TPA: allantoicase [Actinomycetes bacterium]|jgi:allantoicase|nr:allantoicase [Actinomycetes bacterium]